MIYKKTFFSLVIILTTAVQGTSFGGISVDLGLFDFHVGGGISVDSRAFMEDPVCQAIRDTDLLELEIVMEHNESRPETKRLIVEPYALGLNSGGELILRGYQIEGFDVAEAPESGDESNVEGTGLIGGVYSSFKGSNEKKDFNINRVNSIRVIENSDFVIRSEEDVSSDKDNDIVEYICAIRS